LSLGLNWCVTSGVYTHDGVGRKGNKGRAFMEGGLRGRRGRRGVGTSRGAKFNIREGYYYILKGQNERKKKTWVPVMGGGFLYQKGTSKRECVRGNLTSKKEKGWRKKETMASRN